MSRTLTNRGDDTSSLRLLTLRVSAIALCLGVAALPEGLSAQNLIRGTLLEEETERPVAGAAIWLVDEAGNDVHREAELTDSQGRFVFPVPSEGTYNFRVARLGYEMENTFAFEMPQGEDVNLTIYVIPRAVELDALDVQGDRADLRSVGLLSDFYWRSEHGLGKYLTREDLEQYPSLGFTDILSIIPGVSLTPTPYGQIVAMRRATPSLSRLFGQGSGFGRTGPISTTFAETDADNQGQSRGQSDILSQRGSEDELFAQLNVCPAVVWVDGMQLNRHSDASFGAIQLAYNLRAEDIEGIEVYRGPSELPGEFMGPDSRCGVIAIWTRRWIGDGNTRNRGGNGL